LARIPAASREAKGTAKRYRKLQSRRAQADRRRPPQEAEKPMQAGARPYPVPPLPRQHQRKPGQESRLDPPPMYQAPYYKGSFKLLDKVALITGGDSGIGRAVAASQFGADVPMKRPAQPEEIAPAFVFLASPQCSSYITGEILPVIGGYGN
jgi:hypothetical protein